jgi:hypothetical protein
MLPANAVSFDWPPPNDRRISLRKEGAFNIEALDSSGNVIARNGVAFTREVDGSCAVDQIAAAGMPSNSRTSNMSLWFISLVAFGSTCVAAGLILSRKATR